MTSIHFPIKKPFLSQNQMINLRNGYKYGNSRLSFVDYQQIESRHTVVNQNHNKFFFLKKSSTTIDAISMIPIESQNPYGLSAIGIILKFIPKILAIQVGGIKRTLTIVNILMILFCSMLTKPRNVSCK